MAEALARILIVEDDRSLAQWICDYLKAQGFELTVIGSGDLAVAAVREQKPDMVVLDVMLPKKNGFDICRELREFYVCPILMMTACDEESEEIRGLELGADDYLSKPVRPRVLLARIKALLRRTTDTAVSEELTFGALKLTKTTKTVLFRSEQLPLSSKEFDVLWLLASQAGTVISRPELISRLRGIDYDGLDRSIDIRISRLRKKLSDDSEQPHKIRTIWGKGYVFMPGVWE